MRKGARRGCDGRRVMRIERCVEKGQKGRGGNVDERSVKRARKREDRRETEWCAHAKKGPA